VGRSPGRDTVRSDFAAAVIKSPTRCCRPVQGVPEANVDGNHRGGHGHAKHIGYVSTVAFDPKMLMPLARRSVGQPWTLVAAGLMAPALHSAAWRVLSRYGGDRADVDADILLGFIEALQITDPSMRGFAHHLKQGAYQRAINAYQVPTQHLNQSSGPRPVPLITRPGHPDLVLARAVEDKALTVIEAELIGRTRLEDTDLHTAAGDFGLPHDECLLRRKHAETQLARYLKFSTH
jgi:hypothetical protein